MSSGTSTTHARRLTLVAEAIRRVIGVPDYEHYLAHARRNHPGELPLSRDAFAAQALVRRYERPGSRCC